MLHVVGMWCGYVACGAYGGCYGAGACLAYVPCVPCMVPCMRALRVKCEVARSTKGSI